MTATRNKFLRSPSNITVSQLVEGPTSLSQIATWIFVHKGRLCLFPFPLSLVRYPQALVDERPFTGCYLSQVSGLVSLLKTHPPSASSLPTPPIHRDPFPVWPVLDHPFAFNALFSSLPFC
jgi:hypothetical protein